MLDAKLGGSELLCVESQRVELLGDLGFRFGFLIVQPYGLRDLGEIADSLRRNNVEFFSAFIFGSEAAGQRGRGFSCQCLHQLAIEDVRPRIVEL